MWLCGIKTFQMKKGAVVSCKIFSESTGKNNLSINMIHYNFTHTSTFFERLMFLFGKKILFVENKKTVECSTMNLDMHITLLDK